MFGKKKNTENEEVTQDTPETQKAQTEEATAQEPEGKSSGKDALEEEKQKNAELHDKYLRLYSEFDNYRRRTQKERAELIQGGNRELLLHILPVFDDLERALHVAQKNNEQGALMEGLSLIHSKFQRVLNNAGVKEVEAVGGDFDSEVHDAITTIPAPSPEMKGKVIDQIQKGYSLNDKVIRHAKVVVGE